MAKSADATDLKSVFPQGECGFKSHPGHHILVQFRLLNVRLNQTAKDDHSAGIECISSWVSGSRTATDSVTHESTDVAGEMPQVEKLSVPKQTDASLFRKVCFNDGPSQPSGMATALDRGLAGCRLEDDWLGRRFRKLVGQLVGSAGQSIPLA